jgi:hypothetical protein
MSHAKRKNSSFLAEKSAVFVSGVSGVPTVFDKLLLHDTIHALDKP